MRAITIGIDMGGTKTLAIALSDDGNLLASQQIETDRFAEAEKALGDTAQLVRDTIDSCGFRQIPVKGVGIGLAGLITREGIFTDSIIFPRWFSVDAGPILSKTLDLPVIVDNDANMAGMGEWWARRDQSQSIETLLCLTLGTGVGGAIITHGRLSRGPDGLAGELGHITVDLNGRKCACGSKGCLNAYVSGTAIGERYKERLLTIGQDNSSVSEEDVISGLMVSKLASSGDALAREIIQETAVYLGAGLASLANVFNPDVIALTGSVSNLGEQLLGTARSELAQRAWPLSAKRVRVECSRLGTSVGAIGAAVSALKASV